MTSPIVAGIEVLRRAVVVVAGDTTAFSKPHPAPLLEAARGLGVSTARCVYVGDDERDVIAGAAAGMVTAAACWGYLGIDSAVECWGADYLLRRPADALKLVALA